MRTAFKMTRHSFHYESIFESNCFPKCQIVQKEIKDDDKNKNNKLKLLSGNKTFNPLMTRRHDFNIIIYKPLLI